MSILEPGKVALFISQSSSDTEISAFVRTEAGVLYHYKVITTSGNNIFQSQEGAILTDENSLKARYVVTAKTTNPRMLNELAPFYYHNTTDDFEWYDPSVKLSSALWLAYLTSCVENSYTSARSEKASSEVLSSLQLLKEYLCRNLTKWTNQERAVTVNLIRS